MNTTPESKPSIDPKERATRLKLVFGSLIAGGALGSLLTLAVTHDAGEPQGPECAASGDVAYVPSGGSVWSDIARGYATDHGIDTGEAMKRFEQVNPDIESLGKVTSDTAIAIPEC